ncbi:hypothetical protein E4T38_02029 [Aureobasidium subglaciale]|nr:hypothetical protein E4T38_02029 [Aureobasidium subglaciale]KAI5265983.1 hypothetical protein E4T46_01806 [Aureobasidium subglaciale]
MFSHRQLLITEERALLSGFVVLGDYAGKYEDGHDYGHSASRRAHDGDRMPSIRQNYRPRPESPHPSATMSFAQQSYGPEKQSKHHYRRHSSRPHVPVPPTGGGGDGGDIQTSAVGPASRDSRTLNKITICVYRNSKRQFVQKDIWLVREHHRKDGYRDVLAHISIDDTWREMGEIRKEVVFRPDASFFKAIRHTYKTQLRGTIRRFLSFKTVSTARVLGYGNHRFGLADINEKLFSPVFMKVYNDPDQSLLRPNDNPTDLDITHSDWVKWFWKKRCTFVLDKEVDLAIELIEAYDPVRVMGGIALALSIYFTLTIVWLAKGGDPSYVAGVMSFVLSVLAVLVGLTGLYDWLDLGHMGGGKDFLVLGEEDFGDMDKDGGPGI